MSAPPSPKRVKTLFLATGLVWPIRAETCSIEHFFDFVHPTILAVSSLVSPFRSLRSLATSRRNV